MRDVFIKRLIEEIGRNRNMFLMSGDLGFGVFDEFRKVYPNNFINAGVAEQNMTGIATGIALEGNIVFTYSIANFSTLRCLEQIRNDACYHNANVKIVSVGGGFSYGQLGISHHATEDIAIMRSLPEITIFTPSGLWESEKITEAAIKTPGTCYLRLDKSKGNDHPINSEECFEVGKGRVLKKGKDCTIFTVGGILEEVQKAAEVLLKEKEIDVQIVTFPTIKPIDKDLIIKSINQTRNIITVEEHTLNGGLGSIISEIISDNCVFPEKFLRIGLFSEFSSIVGTQEYLRKQYQMDSLSIIRKITELLGK